MCLSLMCLSCALFSGFAQHSGDFHDLSLSSFFIDLLMGLLRGAVFHHGGVPEKLSISLHGVFPIFCGPFSDLNGPFPECFNGPFSS